MIYPYEDKIPEIHPSAFIADHVTITGDVTIGAESSIWFSSVIRGDVGAVIIGDRVNVQDLSCLHQSNYVPVILEDEVTIGHQVTLHSCTVKKGALIGMGAIVLDGAEIGEGALIGAGALVPPGMKIPPNVLAVGSPAKVIRELNDKDRDQIARGVQSYVEKGQYYKSLQKN